MKKSFLTACCIALAMTACRRSAPSNPDLTTPRLAVEALRAKQPFFNAEAISALVAARPGLVTPDDRDSHSERARSFAQATQNPQLWRQLDRKYHFDAVLLCGDSALYRPLLEHLAVSVDWTPVYIDHTSIIFQRAPAKAWQPADLEPVRKKLAAAEPKQRAECLTQIAVKLLIMKQREVARQVLDEALQLDDKSAAAWTASAIYHEQVRAFAAALDATGKALAADEKFRPALEARAQVLLRVKRPNEAYAVSQKLIDLAPEDTMALFIHARAAHEAHAYTTEIPTLTKLIEVLQRSGQPVSTYRIYLGQAYAEKGQGQDALEQFQMAAKSPDLDAAQRAFVQESIQRIKQRTGL